MPAVSINWHAPIPNRAWPSDNRASCRARRKPRPRRPRQALNRLLLPTFGQPTQHDPRQVVATARVVQAGSSSGRLGRDASANCRCNSLGRDELDVFFHEIEPGFEMRQQIQQRVAQPIERSGQATGQLLERRSKLLVRRASMTPSTASAWVRSSRPARNARSVNSPGSASRAPAAQTVRSTRRQQRRRAERVDFGGVLPRVAARSGQRYTSASQRDSRMQPTTRVPASTEATRDCSNDVVVAHESTARESRYVPGRSSGRCLAPRLPGAEAIAAIVSSV